MDRISRIPETDFWKGWGGKADYAALAERHRASTKGEWTQAIEEARRRCAASADRRKAFAQASDLRRGRIHLWHDLQVTPGKRIDFSRCAGRSGLYGLHYMYWVVPLADRFLLERDPKDLLRLIDIVEQYYDQRLGIPRPFPHLDPVYYELGASVKTQSLVPAYLAMIHAGTPTPRAMEAFLKLFVGFGRSLLSLQRTGFRGGNWQIVGSSALYQLGATFADHRESSRWRKRSLEMMRLHLEKDFDRDGGHGERNWPYGWLSLENVIRLYETGCRGGHLAPEVRARFLGKIRNAFRWYLKTVAPGKKGPILPAYGDGTLESADRVLVPARRFLPEREFKAPGRSLCLRDSGYAFQREGDLYLSVNFGAWRGNHTHQDLLDFSLWAFGRPLIEEVGRFGSYDEPLSPYFSSDVAHNQVVIDGHAMHRDKAVGKGIRWHAGKRIDYFSGWHEAYDDAPPYNWADRKRVRIHRRILFVRGAYWVVQDVVEASRENRTAIYTISSWLHSPRPFRVIAPGTARTANCVVAFADPRGLKRLETGADFLKREVKGFCMFPERHFLRARQWGPVGFAGPHVFTMLLLPFQGAAPRASIRSLPGDAFEIRTPLGKDRVILTPGKASWSRGRLSESAR